MSLIVVSIVLSCCVMCYIHITACLEYWMLTYLLQNNSSDFTSCCIIHLTKLISIIYWSLTLYLSRWVLSLDVIIFFISPLQVKRLWKLSRLEDINLAVLQCFISCITAELMRFLPSLILFVLEKLLEYFCTCCWFAFLYC